MPRSACALALTHANTWSAAHVLKIQNAFTASSVLHPVSEIAHCMNWEDLYALTVRVCAVICRHTDIQLRTFIVYITSATPMCCQLISPCSLVTPSVDVPFSHSLALSK